jgi:predicted kinase
MRKILIMGLPGAGKTTLAPLLNAVVFNADAVRANLSRDLGSARRIASSTLAGGAGCATAWPRREVP